jgi:hypothetical protein
MIWSDITKHIFNSFGVPGQPGTFSLIDDKFVIKKELSIELEDGETISKKIWGTSGRVAASTIKILVTDLEVDETEPEYVMIVQLDELSVYALKCDLGDAQSNKAFCLHGENWLELSNLLLAKLLVGVEQLNELFVDYQALPNYQELYKHLISFLNYEEVSYNNNQ